MKRLFGNTNIKDNIVTYSISGIIVACFILFVKNINLFFGFVKDFLGIISPFLWGLLFAYLAKEFAVFVETHLSKKMSFGVRRVIGSVIAILLIVFCLAIILILIIPQLGPSFSSISHYISVFVSQSNNLTSFLTKELNFSVSSANFIVSIINQFFDKIYELGSLYGPAIISTTIDTIGNLFNFGLGLIIALFYLIERGNIKEKIISIGKHLLSKKQFEIIINVYHTSVSKFYGYFRGSIIDSILVGCECFLLMSIFRLEYASLISVIVALTNIIPFFGPFIGGIPSFLLLLLVKPSHALIFACICVAIQQIDGNLIAPKIIGDSVGVPRLWCMFIIIVGGAYFGFFGMLFGVPIFSVIYFFVTDYFNNKKAHIK